MSRWIIVAAFVVSGNILGLASAAAAGRSEKNLAQVVVNPFGTR